MVYILMQLALAYGLVSCFFTAIGILQGQGRPLTIAVAFVLGAWMVGVPLAYVFSHKVNLVSIMCPLLWWCSFASCVYVL